MRGPAVCGDAAVSYEYMLSCVHGTCAFVCGIEATDTTYPCPEGWRCRLEWVYEWSLGGLVVLCEPAPLPW